MQIMEWAPVTNKSDTQAAYSEFHKILCEKYNKFFHIENWISHIITTNPGSQML